MRKIGFTSNLEESYETREKTPYDSHLNKFLRLDVTGGLGATGELVNIKKQELGYSFELAPALFSVNGVTEIIPGPVEVASNGSPISFFPIPKSIEDFVEQVNTKKD